MRFGVVVFPGTWSDCDFHYVISEVLHQPVKYVWHRERDLDDLDCVVLPGGFSYGDYLRAGAVAGRSPVVDALRDFVARGGHVLGSCNGFQILCEAGLLPGALMRNECLQYRCQSTHLVVENVETAFTRGLRPGQVLTMPISHGEGKYHADPEALRTLKARRQIVFRYGEADGRVTRTANPNGSLENIAGIVNPEGTVLGLMPHPERAAETAMGSADGLLLFQSLPGSLVEDGSFRKRYAGLTGAPPKVTLDLARDSGLTAEEYERITSRLGREPTYAELGLFAALWSEHCAYKHSRVYLSRLPTEGARVLQGPGENAGAIDIGDGWAVVFKIESHNHPSFIEPFQGAATGVGGILRDVFTMGARPIALLDSLRFGDLDDPKTRRLVEGVVSGISWYGNCFGCPTVGGEVAFAPEYAGNPLVNVMCVGLVRADQIVLARAEGVGNPVFYVGNKTGRDGIHGATMASATFDDSAAERRPTVQVGDPFTEKLLLEACLEAMKTGAVVGIQDMGAAGLASCTSEMPARAGTGTDGELTLPEPPDYGEALLALCGSPNIASKEWVFRQYDQQVGINTLVLPGSDAAVLRVKGAPRALAVSTDGNGRHVFLDPRRGAAMAVCEAARNVSCSGATPVGVTDCMNFGSPERPEILWQFAQAIDGIAEACRALEIPVVGGNVSFYNDTNGQAILPQPVFWVVGIPEDSAQRATQWFKGAGHRVALLGPERVSLGGSEYLWGAHRRLAGRLAPLDLALERKVQAAVRAVVSAGLVTAAHDCSEGGLAVALAEGCVSGREPVGCEAAFDAAGRADQVLFGEAPSRAAGP